MDDIDDREISLKSGPYALWFHILSLSFFELRDSRHSTEAAESFIFDPENIFFAFVADELGQDPEKLRRRIREALDHRAR